MENLENFQSRFSMNWMISAKNDARNLIFGQVRDIMDTQGVYGPDLILAFSAFLGGRKVAKSGKIPDFR